MKRQYIAPETLITSVEAISNLAHLSGYAIDNDDANPDNIIDIKEENENWPGEGNWPGDNWSGDDWTEDGFYLDLD